MRSGLTYGVFRLLTLDVVLVLTSTHYDHLILNLSSCWGWMRRFLAIVSCKLVLVLQKRILVALRVLRKVCTADGSHLFARGSINLIYFFLFLVKSCLFDSVGLHDSFCGLIFIFVVQNGLYI